MIWQLNINAQSPEKLNSVYVSFLQLQHTTTSWYFRFDPILNYGLGYERQLINNFGLAIDGAIKFGISRNSGIDSNASGKQVHTNLKVGLIKQFDTSERINLFIKLQYFREQTVVKSGRQNFASANWEYLDNWFKNDIYRGLEFGFGLSYAISKNFSLFAASALQLGNIEEANTFVELRKVGMINMPLLENLGLKYSF